ncbi:hypothetical protein SLE2022_050990 [Rubroshorea leprosula]
MRWRSKSRITKELLQLFHRLSIICSLLRFLYNLRDRLQVLGRKDRTTSASRGRWRRLGRKQNSLPTKKKDRQGERKVTPEEKEIERASKVLVDNSSMLLMLIPQMDKSL